MYVYIYICIYNIQYIINISFINIMFLRKKNKTTGIKIKKITFKYN